MKSKLFIIIAVLVVFLAGFMIGKSSVICQTCAPEDVDLSLLWEAWHELKTNYVDPENIDNEKLVHGAISGMISSLDDPYTIFFDPDATKSFLEGVTGEFEGVGMEIGIRDGQLQVIAPLDGTPADKAGLRAGDKILKVDDLTTIDITIEEAVTIIRGEKGTEVTLTILRDGWDTSREFKIKRGVIKVPALDWELLEDDIALINLYHFSQNSDRTFREIALEILSSPAKKIILDLRNNPGGYLERSQDIAGWFLNKDDVVVIEDFGGDQEDQTYLAKGNSKLIDYPIVILINQGSASASEILASALRDNREIQLIGETSFGKGSVQTLRHLTDGSSLKITVARWLTPNGDHINEKGLDPNISVEISEEDFDEDRDPQLEKAIEIIKTMN